MTNERTRLPPKESKALILEAAVAAAVTHGYAAFTRKQVAAIAEKSPALVTVYFKSMPLLRRAVMRQAIKDEALPIIAQGVALGDATALKAPAELRARALGSLK